VADDRERISKSIRIQRVALRVIAVPVRVDEIANRLANIVSYKINNGLYVCAAFLRVDDDDVLVSPRCCRATAAIRPRTSRTPGNPD
jgi:hypothetical protein